MVLFDLIVVTQQAGVAKYDILKVFDESYNERNVEKSTVAMRLLRKSLWAATLKDTSNNFDRPSGDLKQWIRAFACDDGT